MLWDAARMHAAAADVGDVPADSAAVALGPGRGVPLAARPVPLHGEMRSWLRAGMRPAVLQAALQNTGTLLRDAALTISHDIDFGQWDLSKNQLHAAEHQLMHDWAAQAPEVQERSAPSARRTQPQRFYTTASFTDTDAVWYGTFCPVDEM